MPGGYFTPPFREDMGRLPESDGGRLFYYAMQDYLHQASEGRTWTWCEVRPDAIIGFTPNGSTFSLAAHWFNYLSLYAAIEGPGASVPYPGTPAAYRSVFNGASSAMIARFSIHASLHPDRTGNGEIFNIGDQTRPQSMEELWPVIANCFGLKGIPPAANQDPTLIRPSAYLALNKYKQPEYAGSQLTKASWLDEFGVWYTFDRPLSLEKIRSVDFDEERNATTGWVKTFELFQAMTQKAR